MLIDRNQCVPERWGGVGRSVVPERQEALFTVSSTSLWGARSIKLRNRQGRRLVRMVYKTIVYIRNP